MFAVVVDDLFDLFCCNCWCCFLFCFILFAWNHALTYIYYRRAIALFPSVIIFKAISFYSWGLGLFCFFLILFIFSVIKSRRSHLISSYETPHRLLTLCERVRSIEWCRKTISNCATSNYRYRCCCCCTYRIETLANT